MRYMANLMEFGWGYAGSRSRISTASRRSSASRIAKSWSESLPAAWSSSASRISRYLASFSASSSRSAAAVPRPACARRPEGDDRAEQRDQPADPDPGDQRVDDHLEGRRACFRRRSPWRSAPRSAACRLSICAAAGGRQARVRHRRPHQGGERVAGGGVPGPPRTQCLKPLSASRARPMTPPRSGCTAIQRSLRAPAAEPRRCPLRRRSGCRSSSAASGGAEVAAARSAAE